MGSQSGHVTHQGVASLLPVPPCLPLRSLTRSVEEDNVAKGGIVIYLNCHGIPVEYAHLNLRFGHDRGVPHLSAMHLLLILTT